MKLFSVAALWFVLAACATTASASPGIDRSSDLGPRYGEHLPSAGAMMRGRRAYSAGQYSAAFGHYMAAAAWADKFAQYNIGVMYLRGEGVGVNRERGWAWVQLAAEREYPDMVHTANEVYASLSPAQRLEGARILREELLPEFGDSVRIEPTSRRMRRELRQATGSRTGSRAFLSALTVIDRTGRSRRGDEYYNPAKWNFENIVRFETWLMQAAARGEITFRDFRVVEDHAVDDANADYAGPPER